MDEERKINIWKAIIAIPKETVNNYQGVINLLFESYKDGEEIFDIENESGDTPLLLAQRAENSILANIISSRLSIEHSLNNLTTSGASSSSSAAVALSQPKPSLEQEVFVKKAQKKFTARLNKLKAENPRNEATLESTHKFNKVFNIDYPAGKDIFAADYAERFKVILVATRLNHFAIVQEMIEHGFTNPMGTTILNVARKTTGTEKIVELLEKRIGINVSANAASNSSFAPKPSRKTFMFQAIKEIMGNNNVGAKSADGASSSNISGNINASICSSHGEASFDTLVVEALLSLSNSSLPSSGVGISGAKRNRSNDVYSDVIASKIKKENSSSSSSSSSSSNTVQNANQPDAVAGFAVSINTFSSSRNIGTFTAAVLSERNLQAQVKSRASDASPSDATVLGK